jgi:hypothetical protein
MSMAKVAPLCSPARIGLPPRRREGFPWAADRSFSPPCYPAGWRRVAPCGGRRQPTRNPSSQQRREAEGAPQTRGAGLRRSQRRACYSSALLSCAE